MICVKDKIRFNTFMKKMVPIELFLTIFIYYSFLSTLLLHRSGYIFFSKIKIFVKEYMLNQAAYANWRFLGLMLPFKVYK